MIIKSIALKNFRNYDYLNLEFDEKVNIFYGDNAQGKTNILEAIYLCSTSKSHRTSIDKELILFSEEEAHARILIDKNGKEYKIDIHLKKNKKKGVAVNGLPINKVSQLLGILNVIIFSPEDLRLIKDGPKQRRQFIDMELCQLNPIYYYNLQNYSKVLKQRNNLLKSIRHNYNNDLKETVSVWNEQLVYYGSKIIEERALFITKLNKIIYKVHKDLTGGKESINIKYDMNISVDNFLDKLEKSYDKDIKTKNTNYGPHRDDIIFDIDGIDIRKYGSQGQQRTAALSLKISEIELVNELIDDQPILLLDDVLSELDSNRQKYLLENIKDIQTIITCTGIEDFINKNIKLNKVYKVIDGKIEVKN
ncbi:DNA replication and repair protein RecF [Natranaerovirga pectinivora]|uniref:DNA replication and repair protein RecF n=1 Tax=Natranaerovirga pectinivora TaxID=682400 RepID=A0A4R3MEY5_9FIRM|nr:DNA replication/repair protein RecF [Natranaerovirga pectinivora]TCT12237.1 DNA replication and repair protein RecF [Natranaerovirga pectinivora]